MIFGIVALLVAAAVVSAQDLRSYSSRSSRTDTSTSSSDESSDAKRIAKAIELALKEAELSSTLTTSSTSGDVALYRARLQTVNRARTCSFVCGAADGSGTGVIPLPASEQDFFDGVKVTVTALNGVTKTAVFIEDTAENQDDLTGAFDLSAVALGNGNVQFTLTTLQSAFGLNITSITLEVADKAADVDGEPRTQLYFDPLNNPFWDFNTQLALSDVNARVTVDGVTIGCDADFEEIDFVGRTKFTVSAVGTADDDARTLTLNTTAGAFVFNANVFRVRHELSVLNELPYTSLPCSNRTAVTYDEIVVASTGSVESDVDSLLDHPLLYDELKSEANALTPAFDAFVRELQQAAGRRQIDLFDVILDRSAFTISSHDSKFTPCFRAQAPEVEKFEVFVGMRSTSGPDGIIHAVLNVDNGDFQTQSTDTELTNSPSSSDTRSTTEFNTDLSNADDDDVEFLVREVVFSALGLNETLFAETIQGTVDRPYLLLPSDVTVTLEACPQFTYFN